MRLYDLRKLPLRDGRSVWVYLGRPRQVRHLSAIADGWWRGPTPGAFLQLATLLACALPAPSFALDTIASCNAWRNSHGTARILLGNSIGAAHILTKMERLQESPADAPVALFGEGDLQRACGGR
ncbi:hypothetical protein KQ313_01395 [Synechococcus sp. CS-1325]|uniref:hypothetical protein n=1 Tax=Synechococcus sp. CS-1325 TaxID=2847979 RepID=UPI000DB27E3E|nr:hypothetical protein [Synechococcus sp. CS-1325]MCT0198346.1 hypothetical protein [Synechococcus sp. CS-1325]PZV00204.1 MAG: hypothetical protein DCF24_07680 [Cyanobium sp.]